MEIEQLERFANKAVVVSSKGKSSYAELIELVRKCKNNLEAAGAEQGQVVLAPLRSGVEFLAAYLACSHFKLVFAPISLTTSNLEMQEISRAISARFLLRFNGTQFQLCELDFRSFGTKLKELFQAGGYIRFTSGTTAAPKGVFVDPGAATARVLAAKKALNFSEAARVLWPFEMCQHFVAVLPLILEIGGSFVIPSNDKNNSENSLLDCEYIYAGPLHYRSFANFASAPPSLKAAYSTTAPLAGSVRKRIEDSWAIRVRQVYGIFEVGLVAVESLEDASGVAEVVPGSEVKFLNSTKLNLHADCAAIRVRSGGLLQAYLNPLSLRSQFAPDDWFDTGDIGYEVAPGKIRILGRKAALIDLMGQKISPEVVEEFICSQDPIICARVSKYQNSLKAEVVARDAKVLNLNSIKQYCEQHLSKDCVPKIFEQVAALPLNENGKLIRTPN